MNTDKSSENIEMDSESTNLIVRDSWFDREILYGFNRDICIPDNTSLIPFERGIFALPSADEHIEARGYYGRIVRYFNHCREQLEFYNEELWKELNGLSSEYEFDWDYLDLEEKGWYLHVCKNSNVVAFLENIVLSNIA